jgi:hypothetical protein
MAFEAFNRIGGIQSENPDERYAGWIELLDDDQCVRRRLRHCRQRSGVVGVIKAYRIIAAAALTAAASSRMVGPRIAGP